MEQKKGKCRSLLMKRRKKLQLSRKRSKQIFVFLMLAYPVARFILAWAINVNMIPMAFKDYTDSIAGEFVGWDNLLKNFKGIINLYTGEHRLVSEWYALRNTASLYLLDTFINIPISLAFSYLIYIKVKGWRAWQTFLYLPNITSSIVLVLVFRGVIIGGPLNTILNQIGRGEAIPYEGWLGPKYAWPMILIFSIWTGISGMMIYYLAAMRRIPDDFIEAARLDGATEYQIFFKIIFPLMLPNLATLTLLGFTSLVSWSTPSFLMMDSMEGYNYTGTIGLSLLNWSNSRNFGTAAAYGLMVTVVLGPILLVTRRIVDKVTDTIQF